MKKIFTILLILAIVSLGLADKTLTPKDTNTLPPTHIPTPTDTNTLPPTDIPGPTNTNTLPPSPTSTTAPPPDPFKNMTDGCKTAIVSFFTSPDINKCLPLNNLLPLLTALSSKNTTEMFSALKQFASSTCEDPRCNADLINNGKANITKGCLEDDIKKNHNELATMALLGTTLYSPIIESFTKISGPFIDKVVFCTPTTFCTDCNHRISQEVFNFIFDPKHRDVIDTLGLFNVTEAELNQFRLSTMIKCGFEFLKSNKTFPGVCP
ncbi:hypothetical protein F8M41_016515 [Gigaspora margarita]|uniref:Uncharacterized protein n=1 Tax=Gigaspora margarita TaxID=4874 RepID=A0A8H4APC1_GIGMA|nr:hypothetical protein F8M41_016515 [Gigaspora margarita]